MNYNIYIHLYRDCDRAIHSKNAKTKRNERKSREKQGMHMMKKNGQKAKLQLALTHADTYIIHADTYMYTCNKMEAITTGSPNTN